MRVSGTTLLIWLIVAVLLLLAWATVTGKLGRSRHGYSRAIPLPATGAAPDRRG